MEIALGFLHIMDFMIEHDLEALDDRALLGSIREESKYCKDGVWAEILDDRPIQEVSLLEREHSELSTDFEVDLWQSSDAFFDTFMMLGL